MAEFRKGKKCRVCGGPKKNQAKDCLRCGRLMSFLRELPTIEERIKEARKMLGIKDPADFLEENKIYSSLMEVSSNKAIEVNTAGHNFKRRKK